VVGRDRISFRQTGKSFWKTLHLAGFTNRILHPSEEHELLENGYGITSFCKRTTARADELTTEEYVAGGKALIKKLEKYKPKTLAVLEKPSAHILRFFLRPENFRRVFV
jgi:TDG/mug DNA glycosylase family protein